jgi:hypothetical protein
MIPALPHTHCLPLTRSLARIYLATGTLTIATVPFIYWRLDDDIASARFLTPKERLHALERLRANQTGTGS